MRKTTPETIYDDDRDEMVEYPESIPQLQMSKAPAVKESTVLQRAWQGVKLQWAIWTASDEPVEFEYPEYEDSGDHINDAYLDR